jgi:20S proteasome alpha/beta subunit
MSDARRLAAEALFLAAEDSRKEKEKRDAVIVKDEKWRKAQKKAKKEDRRKVQRIQRKVQSS